MVFIWIYNNIHYTHFLNASKLVFSILSQIDLISYYSKNFNENRILMFKSIKFKIKIRFFFKYHMFGNISFSTPKFSVILVVYLLFNMKIIIHRYFYYLYIIHIIYDLNYIESFFIK